MFFFRPDLSKIGAFNVSELHSPFFFENRFANVFGHFLEVLKSLNELFNKNNVFFCNVFYFKKFCHLLTKMAFWAFLPKKYGTKFKWYNFSKCFTQLFYLIEYKC